MSNIKALYNCFGCKGLFVFTLFTISACSPEPAPPMQRGFYHWKTTFAPTPIEIKVIDNQLDKLYLRVFDVVKTTAGAQPEAIVQFGDTVPTKVELVPVVYITNEVMLQELEPGLPLKIAELILHQYQQASQSPLREVQIDCDWTPRSRPQYFRFLEDLKTHLPKGTLLSVTVRLHQFKDPRNTGVPQAADRGMLMLYNTGEVTAIDETNSILRTEASKKWLEGAKYYPLPLDAVLPCFSWVVVHRLGAFHHLMQGFTTEHFMDSSRFEAVSTNQFVCKTTTLFDGYYLHPADLIRVEQVSDTTAQQVWAMFRKAQTDPIGCLAWYHLDATNLSVGMWEGYK